MKKIIFWNVDTQNDFMNADGALYVKGAELIKPYLRAATKYAAEKNITVVNTADWHLTSSKEISDMPDFKTTFPIHCLVATFGSDFITETDPRDFKGNYYIVNWNDLGITWENFDKARNIILYKDAFDVFAGNKFTKEVVKRLAPDVVVVYGVATNVCVNFAVMGLRKMKIKVIALTDAMKELPNIPTKPIFDSWKKAGVIFGGMGLVGSIGGDGK